MSWFQKLMPARIRTEGGNKRNVPEGLWTQCGSCAAVLYRPELERNLAVCPKCGIDAVCLEDPEESNVRSTR